MPLLCGMAKQDMMLRGALNDVADYIARSMCSGGCVNVYLFSHSLVFVKRTR
jgi:hypothetical protein